MNFGYDPADWYARQIGDSEMGFAQGASASGQFAQKWGLRLMAQGATQREMANSKLRRLLARKKTLQITEIAMGGSAIFYEQIGRVRVPKWRSPAAILDIGEVGVTVKFQSQTFQFARFCVRRRWGPSDLVDVNLKCPSRIGRV